MSQSSELNTTITSESTNSRQGRLLGVRQLPRSGSRASSRTSRDSSISGGPARPRPYSRPIYGRDADGTWFVAKFFDGVQWRLPNGRFATKPSREEVEASAARDQQIIAVEKQMPAHRVAEYEELMGVVRRTGSTSDALGNGTLDVDMTGMGFEVIGATRTITTTDSNGSTVTMQQSLQFGDNECLNYLTRVNEELRQQQLQLQTQHQQAMSYAQS